LSIRKYSCSAPSVATTFFASLENRDRMPSAALLSAVIERRSGVFVSRAWPVYETKQVGMQSVEPFSL
jgi:hypothetical protein